MEILSPYCSPLLLKVSIIFMVTQLTSLFLWQSSGHFLSILTDWMPFTLTIWPQEVLIGRILQILSISMFYMWRIYCADDWIWCNWLTPKQFNVWKYVKEKNCVNYQLNG